MTPDFTSHSGSTMLAFIYTLLILTSMVGVCFGSFDASEIMPHSKYYSLPTFHEAVDDGLHFVIFYRTW